ncbi:hypothetical protein B7463_g12271, partial [Scytalidium lignicola]
MVGSGYPLPRKGFGPPRDPLWHPLERFQDPSLCDDRSSTGGGVHPRSLSIETALRDCVGLPVKDFALIVSLENGEEKTYTSHSLTPFQPQIFTDQFKHGFRRGVQRSLGEPFTDSAHSQEGDSGEFDFDGGNGYQKARRRRMSQSGSRMYQRGQSYDSDSDTSGKRRKRSYGQNSGRRRERSIDAAPVVVQSTQQLRIGDEKEVTKFYHLRFKDLQQSACKIIGKIFVKVVEPKKQTHYPYTGGAAKAPPWWPPTTGENAIRHKEPDHLYKHERVLLLVQILRMIIEPAERQHQSVRRWNLDVKTLEAKTMEAMGNWFNDSAHPANAAKKVFLKEIFKVAKAEERFKNGEIDDDTVVPVMDRNRQGHVSEDEEEDDGGSEPDESDTKPTIPSPDSQISPHSTQPGPSMHHQPRQEDDSSSLFHSMRQPQFADNSYSTRPVTLGYQQQSPILQDPNRRAYSSQPYQNQSQNIYGWQNNMVSNGPISSNYYVSSPQSALAPPNVGYQLPLPNTQQHLLPPPSMNKPTYDSVPTSMQQYDTTAPALGHQMRTVSIGHPHQLQTHNSFHEYMHDNPYAGNEDDNHVKHVHHG